MAVTNEVKNKECRVALTPLTVSRLVKTQIKVLVEKGAGEGATFSDADYENAGATVVSDYEYLLKEAQVILKVGTLQKRGQIDEVDIIRPGSVVVGFLNPHQNRSLVKRLTQKKITAFSMEMIPRITRAQSMDALSSQASIIGYKAALLAANKLGKFFQMMTTAAGTMSPAKVLVVGAGVAGLQAIATARRLGALVEGFDIRPASKAEVESLGAKFVEVKLAEKTEQEGYAKEVSEDAKRHEQEVLAERVGNSDVVITTALVPGKKAPVLITKEMVAKMKKGSLIVDVAAEQGGNCELTAADREVVYSGVAILGPVNLPATMPVHASQMYSKNISSFLLHIVKNGKLDLDFDDELVRRSCITHEGTIRIE